MTAALAAGQSIRAVARRYNLTHTTLAKHVRQHTGPALLAHNLAEPILAQLRRLHARTLAVLTRAEESGDLAIVLSAIRECRHDLALCGKLTGELKNPEASEPTRVEIVIVDKPIQ
jgi:hypothetical protein